MYYSKVIADFKLSFSDGRAVMSYVGSDPEKHMIEAKQARITEGEAKRLLAEFKDRSLIRKPLSVMPTYFPRYAQEFTKHDHS